MSASDSPPPVSSLLAQLHEERLRRQAAAGSPNRDSVPAAPAAQGEQPAPRLSSPVCAIAGVHSNEAAPAPRSPQILPPPRDDGDGSHDQQQIPVAAVVPTPAHQDHESKAAAAAEADWDDFSCVVCLKLLLEPVALRCGHTFCRRCLQRALAVKVRLRRLVVTELHSPMVPRCPSGCALCAELLLRVALQARRPMFSSPTSYRSSSRVSLRYATGVDVCIGP